MFGIYFKKYLLDPNNAFKSPIYSDIYLIKYIIKYTIKNKMFQIVTMVLVGMLLVASASALCKKFQRKDVVFYVTLPLAFFLIGFIMRLSQKSDVTDLGFFFTEISYIWVALLYTLSLLLGQLKYWGK